MTTARLIIQLHSRKFTHFLDEAQIELSEVRLDLRCKSDNHNELIISGFSHEKEALIYLDKLRLAFFFMMLDDDIIVDACLDAQEVQLHSNVENGCTFRSANGRPSTHVLDIPYGYIHETYEGGGCTTNASVVLQGIRKGLIIAATPIKPIDEDLRLALDLYRGSLLQENLRARFIMLIISMERLAGKEKKGAREIALIEVFIDLVKNHDLAETEKTGSNKDAKDLQKSILNTLDRMKTKHPRKLIIREVKEVYANSTHLKRAKGIVEASFAKRNDIVHEGRDVTLEQVEGLESVQRDLLKHRILTLPNHFLDYNLL